MTESPVGQPADLSNGELGLLRLIARNQGTSITALVHLPGVVVQRRDYISPRNSLDSIIEQALAG